MINDTDKNDTAIIDVIADYPDVLYRIPTGQVMACSGEPLIFDKVHVILNVDCQTLIDISQMDNLTIDLSDFIYSDGSKKFVPKEKYDA